MREHFLKAMEIPTIAHDLSSFLFHFFLYFSSFLFLFCMTGFAVAGVAHPRLVLARQQDIRPARGVPPRPQGLFGLVWFACLPGVRACLFACLRAGWLALAGCGYARSLSECMRVFVSVSLPIFRLLSLRVFQLQNSLFTHLLACFCSSVCARCACVRAYLYAF